MRSAPDIIIPVHNAFDALVDCLESVARTAPQARVTVIDDASTDARILPHIRQWIDGAKQRRLWVNSDNLGFVQTANRALSEIENDVVLLNSDTMVTSGWLEALERCLASDPQIATATPWSNNGEVVSLPEFCQVNPVPRDPECVARAVSECKMPAYPDLPTAVGFCMAISRAAIDRLGLFDHATFGQGYGEENDFSMRAMQAGMRNVLCDDAYVVHVGGQSFAPLGLRPDEGAMQRLLSKHPAYLDLVKDYIRRDPLADQRAFIWERQACVVSQIR